MVLWHDFGQDTDALMEAVCVCVYMDKSKGGCCGGPVTLGWDAGDPWITW